MLIDCLCYWEGFWSAGGYEWLRFAGVKSYTWFSTTDEVGILNVHAVQKSTVLNV